jgi:hypothetical protein
MSAANHGQSEKTQLGMGFIAMGDGPAVNDPFSPANRAASLRAELAALETQIRGLQEQHANKLAQLAKLEADA